MRPRGARTQSGDAPGLRSGCGAETQTRVRAAGPGALPFPESHPSPGTRRSRKSESETASRSPEVWGPSPRLPGVVCALPTPQMPSRAGAPVAATAPQGHHARPRGTSPVFDASRSPAPGLWSSPSRPRRPRFQGWWSAAFLPLLPAGKGNLGPARTRDILSSVKHSLSRRGSAQSRGLRGGVGGNSELVRGDVRRRRGGSPAETAVYEHRAILGWFPLRRSPRETVPERPHGQRPLGAPGTRRAPSTGGRMASGPACRPLLSLAARAGGKSAAGSPTLGTRTPGPHPWDAARDRPLQQRHPRWGEEATLPLGSCKCPETTLLR